MTVRVVAESTDARRLLRCMLNGELIEREVPVTRMLIDLLRDELGLTGAKRSCDVEVCGACTVLVDGRPVSSCTYLAFEAHESEITTIEGLETDAGLHPLQQAFIDEDAMQCGYCTPGMIMTALALLEEERLPGRQRVIEYMHGNLCRCTGYKPIVAAILAAAEHSRHA